MSSCTVLPCTREALYRGTCWHGSTFLACAECKAKLDDPKHGIRFTAICECGNDAEYEDEGKHICEECLLR